MSLTPLIVAATRGGGGGGWYRIGEIKFPDSSVLQKSFAGKKYTAIYASRNKQKAHKEAMSKRAKGMSVRVLVYKGYISWKPLWFEGDATCYVVYSRE